MRGLIKRFNMAKYINIEKFENTSPYCPNCGNDCKHECEFFMSVFAEDIAEDVAPVVHAKWFKSNYDYICTNCGIHSKDYHNYCPNCGAKMDIDTLKSAKQHGCRVADDIIDLCVEALERLAPLPPYDKEFVGAVVHYCPRCGEELELHPSFCDGCGQAIDWSD